jgi:hypothetical protein
VKHTNRTTLDFLYGPKGTRPVRRSSTSTAFFPGGVRSYLRALGTGEKPPSATR